MLMSSTYRPDGRDTPGSGGLWRPATCGSDGAGPFPPVHYAQSPVDDLAYSGHMNGWITVHSWNGGDRFSLAD
jgi:hypothetical protein